MSRGKQNGLMSKRAFVLSLPLDLPAKEVIERAAQQGIKLKDTYVYVVRSNAKKKPASKARNNGLGLTSTNSAELEFRRLALELGLGKSRELLQETEQMVEALINGS